MPVCVHRDCYNHVPKHGQVCPNHRPKRSSTSSKLTDNIRRDHNYRFIVSQCLRAADKAERGLKQIAFGCGHVGVYLPRQYKFTKWLVKQGYARQYENFVALELPQSQTVHQLETWARAFIAKMSDFDEGYAKCIRLESRLT